MMNAVIDGRMPHAHQFPVSSAKKYSRGKATSRNGTMNTASALVSGSTRSSRAVLTSVVLPLRPVTSVGRDDPPEPAVEIDVVAEHLPRPLVRVGVERLAGVGHLPAPVASRDRAQQRRAHP